ncbi:MAG: VCBS repeat-containing protein [Phycisphaerales bacterium]
MQNTARGFHAPSAMFMKVGEPEDLAIRDVNGDSLPDILIAMMGFNGGTGSSGGFYLLLNLGNQTFSEPIPLWHPRSSDLADRYRIGTLMPTVIPMSS